MTAGFIVTLMLMACGDTAPAQGDGATASVAKASASAAGMVPPHVADPVPSGDLLARLQVNFDRATRGEKGAAVTLNRLPKPANAGMDCAPARLSPDRPDLAIDLPAAADQRRNVLAVITPERGLQVIYEPYGPDVEASDLVIPDQGLSWAQARTNRHFAVRTDALDAVSPGGDQPFGVFLEAGVYQFALISGVDRALLDANGMPFRVVAGCAVAWTPATTG